MEDQLDARGKKSTLTSNVAEFLPKVLAVHPTLFRKLQSTWVWLRMGSVEDCVACQADESIGDIAGCKLYGASASASPDGTILVGVNASSGARPGASSSSSSSSSSRAGPGRAPLYTDRTVSPSSVYSSRVELVVGGSAGSGVGARTKMVRCATSQRRMVEQLERVFVSHVLNMSSVAGLPLQG